MAAEISSFLHNGSRPLPKVVPGETLVLPRRAGGPTLLSPKGFISLPSCSGAVSSPAIYPRRQCNVLDLAGTRTRVAAGPRQPTLKVSHPRYKMSDPNTYTTYNIKTAHDVMTHQHKTSDANRPRVTLVVDLFLKYPSRAWSGYTRTGKA